MTQKLSKATQGRLASLINAVAVWNNVTGSAEARGDGERAGVAHEAYKEAALALYDEFGIVLPCTQRWYDERNLKWIADDRAEQATLDPADLVSPVDRGEQRMILANRAA